MVGYSLKSFYRGSLRPESNAEYILSLIPHVPGIVTHVSARGSICTHGYESHNLWHIVYDLSSFLTYFCLPFSLFNSVHLCILFHLSSVYQCVFVRLDSILCFFYASYFQSVFLPLHHISLFNSFLSLFRSDSDAFVYHYFVSICLNLQFMQSLKTM